jgi:hypothetical protein
MTMKPTRYEYEAPTRIHGTPIDVHTKIEATQQAGGHWTATLTMTSTPSNSAAEAQIKLREECVRIAATLAGGVK